MFNKRLLIAFLLVLLLVAACGPSDEARMDAALATEVTIYDYDGNVVDQAWLANEFGPVAWAPVEPWDNKDITYRLTELHAQCDYATLKVCVEDANGNPINGVSVVRYWPGAPALPDFSDLTYQWTSLGVYGPTEGEGCIGFGMGAGDYYYPSEGQIGASSVYVADVNGPSDMMIGLGMIAATNHCHLDTVFQAVSDELPEPPTPTPEPTSESGGWNIDITIKGTIDRQ